MAKSSVKVQISDIKAVDSLLGRMPIELREKTLVKAVRAAGNAMAKEARRLIPKPGYPGDIPGKEPLNKMIRTVVRKYPNAITAFVGPRRVSDPHGHLLEYGHAKVLWGKRTSERVRPYPFMRPAADSTLPQQQAAIVNALKKEIGKLGA